MTKVRLQIGAFEYQVMVPEAVRRQIQLRVGQEVTFHITEYFEGNSAGSRFVPRRIGFNTEMELEFFELFCTVEKIGVKKALEGDGASGEVDCRRDQPSGYEMAFITSGHWANDRGNRSLPH